MKPYGKTFRALKTHKAEDCDLCAEQVKTSRYHEKQLAKKDIEGWEEELMNDYIDECMDALEADLDAEELEREND